MARQQAGWARVATIWTALGFAILIPIGLALGSPLLAWREPVYIVAGLAGILAFATMLLQPLLVSGALPRVPALRGRFLHRWLGGILVTAIILHVTGLWITSPPDVIDALLFVSPTPFSDWGVVAMWAVFAAALLAALRKRLRLRPGTWRKAHVTLVIIAVIGTVAHVLLIEGTMEPVSKIALSAFVLIATARTILALGIYKARPRTETPD